MPDEPLSRAHTTRTTAARREITPRSRGADSPSPANDPGAGRDAGDAAIGPRRRYRRPHPIHSRTPGGGRSSCSCLIVIPRTRPYRNLLRVLTQAEDLILLPIFRGRHHATTVAGQTADWHRDAVREPAAPRRGS